ncbi:MAG: AAA family ATPase, partial [Actinobacteria bacterium]|nr:AAA family ATPase [Actinomycetota bacterium]
ELALAYFDLSLMRDPEDEKGLAQLVKAFDDLGEKGSGPSPFPEPYFHAVVQTKDKVVAVEGKTESYSEWVPRTDGRGGTYVVWDAGQGRYVPELVKVTRTREVKGYTETVKGKTTVARLVAAIYKALGLIKKGHVIEADCSKLVAAYIGQTPIKTQRLCEQARGGVLFIDEAYGLAGHQHQGYGPEAIETLLKFMEDNRGDFVVVAAGYPVEMQQFLDANPGLRSRFDIVIDFPDYASNELESILDIYLDEHEFRVTPEAREKIRTYIASLSRGRGFGNGRAMRNFFNEMMRIHSLRVSTETEMSVDDLTLVTDRDVPAVRTIETGAATVSFSGRGYL